LITCLKDYSKEKFFADCIAGFIVGIVAIPLAIAFAIASGVSPDKGLFTAIVAGFLISVLGGSRVQIGGPTGAFVVIVYGIVQKYGVDGLVIATFMAGILLMIMGAAKLGTAVKFIPHSVIVGFTSGIAVIIFSSQIKDLMGLHIDKVPAEFVEKWRVFIQHAGTLNYDALALGVLTVLIIALAPRILKRVPGALIALISVSAIAAVFRLPVETIGSRFGELPHTLPVPHIPNVGFCKAPRAFSTGRDDRTVGCDRVIIVGHCCRRHDRCQAPVRIPSLSGRVLLISVQPCSAACRRQARSPGPLRMSRTAAGHLLPVWCMP